jgi:hypothetical protein
MYDSTEDGGGATPTTTQQATNMYTTTHNSSERYTSSAVTLNNQNTIAEDFGGIGGANHNHGILHGLNLMVADGNWQVGANGNIFGGQTEAFVASGAHIHEEHHHIIDIYAHYHNVEIPAHQHSVTILPHRHFVYIPSHHHSVTIPDHTHALEFGIFQGETAQTISIRVDGNTITLPPNSGLDHIDARPFLQTDGGGRIARGRWHRIEIVPNRMTKISAWLFLRFTTNSRNGGVF